MRYRHRNSRRSSFDFLLPFFILLCAGVVIVLLFSLWRAIFSSDPGDAAYMHIDSGTVQIKTWGTEQFFDLRSDALVMQGDQIILSANAKVILEFFDGTIIRLSGGSDVTFDYLEEGSGESGIELSLNEGDLWLNRVFKDTQTTSVMVLMDGIRVQADSASIVALTNEIEQEVRVLNVFDGGEGALVEILNEEKSKVIENERVDVGQEVVVNPKIMQSYFDFKSPTVLSALSDGFKDTDWYTWNVEEDRSPTEFEKYAGPDNAGLIKVDPETIDNGEIVEPDQSGDEEANDSEENSSVDGEVEEVEGAEEAVVTGEFTSPSVSSVSGVTETTDSGFYKIFSNVGTITGTVSGASKVVVNGYTLTKFSPGDTTWTYYANADYGLMQPGENTYEIYSVDADGNKSEVVIVKVYYEKVEPVVEEEAPAEEVVEDPVEDTSSEDEIVEDASGEEGDGSGEGA